MVRGFKIYLSNPIKVICSMVVPGVLTSVFHDGVKSFLLTFVLAVIVISLKEGYQASKEKLN